MDEDVRRVRDEADIVRIITEHTQLKKTGTQWKGLCPFHGEKTPSFSVSAEKGFYYCFGCQVSGDVIDFVRETEGLDFAGSVEFLAAKAGIPLRYTDRNEGRRRNRKKEHAEIVQRAVDFYHDRLLTHPDARPARDYLRSRGYDGDVARLFSIGWAPDDWSLLANHLKLSDDELQATGLGGINRRGKQYDFFRARIVFPIFDKQGNAVGFGGRILPDGEGPKYKNTADTAEYYSKSDVLYGLHQAKGEAGRTDELVVCEGYTDVIGCHQAGIERAVATCGTALTASHAQLIKRFAKRVVLAFDADGAGKAAAERVYAWEEEFDLRFTVAALPEGVDPGDLARKAPEKLKLAIEGARPFLEFRVDQVLERGDLESAEGRAWAAADAMALVSQHPNAIVRDQYVIRIADRCLVSVDEVRRLGDTTVQNRSEVVTDKRERGRAPASGEAHLATEIQALRMLVHRPDEISKYLDPVLFHSSLHRGAVSILISSGDLHAARSAAGAPVADLLGRLAVADVADEEPLGVLTRLFQLAGERAAVALEAEARLTGDLADYQPAILFLRTEVIRLREVVSEGASLEPLLRWLVDESKGPIEA